MKKLILLLAIFLFNISVFQSQIIDKYSISGKGTLDPFSDFYFEGVDINVFSKSFLYTIGYYYGEDYEFFGDTSNEHYNQLNLLFGKYIDLQHQNFRIRYQAGIGMFWGALKNDEYDKENSTFLNDAYFTDEVSTIGFPIKIGGRYIPFKFLSIGVDIQANLNFEKSIIRPMLCLDIGKLKN